MQIDLTSLLIGFLSGAATVAVGTYFAYKYTDRRREKEASKQAKRDFLKIKAQMPDLISEIKKDLSNEKNKFIREFFVLPNKKVCLGGSQKPRFIYYAEEYDDLHGKLTIMENMGYLIDVTLKNTPIFRMTEEFVELLRKYG